MADRESSARGAHNVIMENRHSLSISGVRDVDSFDEQAVVLLTELGELAIRGESLHISHLDQESGELRMTGDVSELIYSQPKSDRKGFFARLTR